VSGGMRNAYLRRRQRLGPIAFPILSGMMVQTISRRRKNSEHKQMDRGSYSRHLRCSLRRPLRSALQPMCALTKRRRRSGSQLGQYQRRSDQVTSLVVQSEELFGEFFGRAVDRQLE
jgi:hypothetical protein